MQDELNRCFVKDNIRSLFAKTCINVAKANAQTKHSKQSSHLQSSGAQMFTIVFTSIKKLLASFFFDEIYFIIAEELYEAITTASKFDRDMRTIFLHVG